MENYPFEQRCKDVLISEITISEDCRALDDEKVNSLADGIRETGLLQPVGLTPDYRLIYGRRRLAAYEKLGYASIPAIIHEYGNELLVELAMIDENLQRNALSALEEDRALARRKQIFEELHPEAKPVTKRGGPGRGKKTSDKMSHVSFAEDTAAKTGQSRRSVERKVKIGQELDPQAAETLKDTPVEDNQSELKAISKLRAEEQREIAAKMKAGEIRSVGKAQPGTAKADAIEKGLKAIETLESVLRGCDLYEDCEEPLHQIMDAVENYIKAVTVDCAQSAIREPREAEPVVLEFAENTIEASTAHSASAGILGRRRKTLGHSPPGSRMNSKLVYSLRSGVRATPEFHKKGLAQYAVNVGVKCGHDCAYCSSGAQLRRHKAFKELHQNPFAFGYSIVDPDIPEKVSKDAKRITKRGVVELCTTVDAWAPAAQEYNLGRRCLEAILAQPGWVVRILTKNAAVVRDFDVVKRYQERVLVGLSLTGTPDMQEALAAIEPNASSISERMAAMKEACRLELRTYGMLCPLLPGVANDPSQIEELVQFVKSCGAEEVFCEAVNPRGPGLKLTEEALRENGFVAEAEAVHLIRQKKHWSPYVAKLVGDVQAAMRKHMSVDKLRFLLYPARLTDNDLARIKADDSGVVWLYK